MALGTTHHMFEIAPLSIFLHKHGHWTHPLMICIVKANNAKWTPQNHRSLCHITTKASITGVYQPPIRKCVLEVVHHFFNKDSKPCAHEDCK